MAIPATEIVAERIVVPVFAGTVYVPVPDPVRPADRVSHAALVDDVQTHPDCVVTVIVPVPPPGGAATRSGLTENVHDALGSVTTKLLPAMVSVALRAELVVLAAAKNDTVPAPLPLAPLLIVTHEAPLAAVQPQPLLAATDTMLLPPLADIDAAAAVSEYEHGAASWVTVNVWPPIVSVPVRVTVPPFAVAE